MVESYREELFCTDAQGERFVGNLIVHEGIIGQGTFKNITGHAFYLTLPQDVREIYLGAVGTPVEATPKATDQDTLFFF